MAAASAPPYVSTSTTAIATSTLSSSTTHLYWGYKVWTYFLSLHKSSLDLFSLCRNYLFQLVWIVCFAGFLLTRFSFGTLAILPGFEIGSLLGFILDF